MSLKIFPILNSANTEQRLDLANRNNGTVISIWTPINGHTHTHTHNKATVVWVSLHRYQDLIVILDLQTWQHSVSGSLQPVAPEPHHSGTNSPNQQGLLKPFMISEAQ